MNLLASTVIAVPGDKVIIKLIETDDPGLLTVELKTSEFGKETQVLPRDEAWTEYQSQVNMYFK